MATADDSRYYSEHDDRVGVPKHRNRKGRGPFRAPMYSDQMSRPKHRGGHGGGGGLGPRSRLPDDDGDVTMSDTPQDNSSQRNRFNPYGRPSNRRDERNRKGGRGGGNGGDYGGHRSHGSRGGGGSGCDGNRKNWFKMTIPFGKKYDKDWLLSALQNLCSIPFHAVHYHTEGNKAQFYIEDSTTANALVKVSRKITDKDGYKVTVIMNSCPPPTLIHTDLKPEDLEHLKQCMSKRFDGSQQSLDLNNIRVDPDLNALNVEVTLNRKNSMQAVIKIIEENIPELVSLNLSNNRLYRLDDLADIVSKIPNLKMLNLSHNELKTERELDKLKGLKMVEILLVGNPMCNHFKDHADYVSAVRERFPKLLKLDGLDLPPPIGFDLEVPPATLPPCKPSFFGSEDMKSIILSFLQQYFSVYDSGNRQPLLEAYHDGATFSLGIPFSLQNPAKSSLGEYQKDSRNIKRLKDPSTRFRLLKHTRLNVVAFLNELPRTQHDVASFNVDVNTYTNTLLAFTVTGVFKEVDGKSRDSFRAFSRVFIAVPAGNAGLCIVNDELFVRNATTEEIRCAFVAPAPTPSSSPVPTLSAVQQEMLAAFSLKSGMNLEWSQKCLQDNDWDFERAAQIFSGLKAHGKIPDVAFVK
ncbi:nuclear RNA export factor 1 [Triplophysa rosa]|uniref:Nuclear RNA export factor 1 n=1 Tax=Triplophysa rosa TaxID=992332 RepID=A0A9W7TFY1_TRIRA|nr:nuclear RNA export factor 1 [Triplophysa rosa]KAI7796490.1 putative nuclear RNA export factor 1 [Triplophysa rosa]